MFDHGWGVCQRVLACVSFSKEFIFTDVGDTGIIVELVLETQTTGNTTLDFKEIENIIATTVDTTSLVKRPQKG